MDFLSPAWLWLYLGAFLMLAELASPGFVVFFFGLAAATVAVLKWCIPGLPMAGQLAAFSVFSILYLVVLRRYMKKIFSGDTAESNTVQSEYIGRVGKVVEVIRPEVPGRILLGDAEWAATAAERLEPGTEVKVTAQNNLTLTVEKLA